MSDELHVFPFPNVSDDDNVFSNDASIYKLQYQHIHIFWFLAGS